jgi:hypothetical protein
VNTFKKLAIAAGLCAAGFTSHTVQAQTTDGFHTIQVFPVVVDSGSFTQRFTFRNRNSTTVNISATYFPGGGSQVAALSCGSFTVSANSDRTFNTLRNICPALTAGSNYGFLYTYEIDQANLPYSAFSRVANPQGNGFAVEAFSAKEFTSATSTVPGLRREAATINNPAFQTNCFIGVMNDITGPATATVPVAVAVVDSAGAQLGSTLNLNIAPGTLVRLLDIFASVGAPAGNHNNARMTVSETAATEPGIMSFCTVQDNTSFGADFRVAKQEDNGGGQGPSGVAAQSDYVSRDINATADNGRTYEIGTGASAANTHVVYFHHPDWVQCEIIDPNTGVRALTAYGIEMRMLGNDAATLWGGGSSTTGFGEVYLGDKNDYNSGADGRYLIEVESNGNNTASTRPYRLKCQSGSGSTLGELIKYKEVVNRF